MNLLPLIFSFLLVIGLITTTLMQTSIQITEESRLLRGRLQASWDLRSLEARTEFAALKATSLYPPKKETHPTPTPLAPRTNRCLHEEGKFNVSSLLSGKASHLYEPAARLLKRLYGKKSFWEPNLEYVLLDALIENKDRPLWELEPRNVFYTLLQGTNTYDDVRGIPPLLDYFIFDSSSRPPVILNEAPAVLLDALFGTDVVRDLMRQEKELNKRLSVEELKGILQKYKIDFDLNLLPSIVKASSSKASPSVVTHDSTGISVRS